MSNLTNLELSAIRTDGGTQPRAKINQDLILEYAEAMKAGDNFPPVTVFYDGGHYWLADGYHRLAAAERVGIPRISVDLQQGTRREAVLYSVGVNATHGLRRSPADKRRAVETLLQDPEWKNWSDRAIAKTCKVDNKTVARIKADLGIPKSESRKSTNGRIINTTNIGRRRKSESTASEPGSEGLDASFPGENPTLISPTPNASAHAQLQNEVSAEAELIAEDISAENATSESDLSQAEATPKEAPARFQVGDRFCIRRQHGEDNWADKTASIWQVTPEGRLGVDVEGHKGVRFSLHSDWVERIIEQPPEPPPEPPEPAMPQVLPDEADPESPAMVSDRPSAIAEEPSEAKSVKELPPQFQAGDRLQVTNLAKQNEQWTGEVAEVLKVSEAEIKVIVRVPRQLM